MGTTRQSNPETFEQLVAQARLEAQDRADRERRGVAIYTHRTELRVFVRPMVHARPIEDVDVLDVAMPRPKPETPGVELFWHPTKVGLGRFGRRPTPLAPQDEVRR